MRKKSTKIKINDIDLLVQIAQKMNSFRFLKTFELDSHNTTMFLALLTVAELENTDRMLNEWDLAMLSKGKKIWQKKR
jgi:hypothetical protein